MNCQSCFVTNFNFFGSFLIFMDLIFCMPLNRVIDLKILNYVYVKCIVERN
jgi:hypothetical protein